MPRTKSLTIEQINTYSGTDTVEYCVLPEYVNSENMFHGTQYYETTMYMIGAKEIPPSLPGQHFINYSNDLFEGRILFEHNPTYGYIIRSVEANRNTWYSCNGEETAPKFLQAIFNNVRAMAGGTIINQHSLETYFFKRIKH